MQIGSDYSGSMLNSPDRLLRPRADPLNSANSTNLIDLNSEATKVAIVGSVQNLGTQVSTDPNEQENTAQTTTSETNNPEPSAEKKLETVAYIAELKSIEREVIAHEAAHLAVAGGLGSGPNYNYTTGPDGKKYINGGDVRINTPASRDPEETLRNAEQVIRAALAPVKPSGQDISVAAGAAQVAANARAEIAASKFSDSSRLEEGAESTRPTDEIKTATEELKNARSQVDDNNPDVSLATNRNKTAIESYSYFAKLIERQPAESDGLRTES